MNYYAKIKPNQNQSKPNTKLNKSNINPNSHVESTFHNQVHHTRALNEANDKKYNLSYTVKQWPGGLMIFGKNPIHGIS